MSIQSYELTLMDTLKIKLYNQLSSTRSALIYEDTLDNVVNVQEFMDSVQDEIIYSYTTPAETPAEVKGYEIRIIPFVDAEEESSFAEHEDVKFAITVSVMDFDVLSEPINIDHVHVYPFSSQSEFNHAFDLARVAMTELMKKHGIEVAD